MLRQKPGTRKIKRTQGAPLFSSGPHNPGFLIWGCTGPAKPSLFLTRPLSWVPRWAEPPASSSGLPAPRRRWPGEHWRGREGRQAGGRTASRHPPAPADTQQPVQARPDLSQQNLPRDMSVPGWLPPALAPRGAGLQLHQHRWHCVARPLPAGDPLGAEDFRPLRWAVPV